MSAEALRTVIRAMSLTPELVLVSSSRRTLQTLEALGPWDHAPTVRPLDALYLASAPDVIELIAAVDEAVRCVLVVGHNPGLHDAALRLARPGAVLDQETTQLQANFPTGALAVFKCASWAGLDGGATLERFVVPRDLPATAA